MLLFRLSKYSLFFSRYAQVSGYFSLIYEVSSFSLCWVTNIFCPDSFTIGILTLLLLSKGYSRSSSNSTRSSFLFLYFVPVFQVPLLLHSHVLFPVSIRSSIFRLCLCHCLCWSIVCHFLYLFCNVHVDCLDCLLCSF